MPVQDSELKFYKAASVNDTSTCGGKLSATEIVSGVKNNTFPDISQAERAAGTTRFRKIFSKIASAENLAFQNSKIFLERSTPGDDRIVMFPGTQTDTKADLTGSERLYGVGKLQSDVSVGEPSVIVITEAGADAIFQDGDLIRISNQDGVNDNTGKEEWIRLAASNAVSWNGDQATLTFLAGNVLANAYAATSTRVASVIEAGTIQPTVTGWSEISASGTYNEGTYPVVPNSIGTIKETWTLTFTNATNYTVQGSVVGSVGTGSIGGGDFAPDNINFTGHPYFTLKDAGWGGTWASGETIVFSTTPAAYPLWLQHIVPAGANSISGNAMRYAIAGESA
ncbi:MAG: hypothetical protein HQL07_03860 [Nitrospirae bacterium]|nr:hypothetical protein [Magnetococcales bacterium]HAT48856.1 hypothetical protein [Alphaproteobacteria bacterium]